MVGLGIGSQPIVGYNYGARRFDRVKATYLRTIIIGLTAGVLGWLCFREKIGKNNLISLVLTVVGITLFVIPA